MINNKNDITKGRKIAGWILAGILGTIFIMSASMKFLGGEKIAEGLTKYGLDGKVLLIGSGELISVILYLISRTSSLGVLLLSAYMGGAIATHMEHGEMYLVQSVILLVIWISHWLRNPEMLSSFSKK
jgi:hypothetical protein